MPDVPGPLPAGSYGRQSDDRNSRDRSVSEQHDDNRAEAEANGWRIVAKYEDADTPASRYSKKVREDWDRLLRDIENDLIRVLILWESSRGSRRVGEWASLLDLCEDHGVKIHVTTHHRTYDPHTGRDRRTLLEDAVDAEYESSKISDRVLRAIRRNREQGLGHGRCPYGWRRVYDERRRLVRTEIIPEESAIRAEITRRVARGEAINRITKDLNDRGVKPPAKSKTWSRVTVRFMAIDPANVALLNDGKTPAAWEPVVDLMTFLAAKRVADERKEKHTRPGAAKHLLTYLAVCGVCGEPLQASPAPQGRTGRYMCSNPGRHCVAIIRPVADEAVTRVVLKRLADPEFLRYLGAGDDAAVLAAREEAAALRERLAEFVSESIAGRISPATLGKIDSELTAQIEDADRRAEQNAMPLHLRELSGAGDLRAKWDALPLSSKKDVLRIVFDRIELMPAAHRGRNVPDPNRVRFTLRGEQNATPVSP